MFSLQLPRHIPTLPFSPVDWRIADGRSRLRLDRKRKGKTLSNADWTSKTDPEAKNRQDEGRDDASGLQA